MEALHRCNAVLREQGKAYPRTCAHCALGPCPFFNPDGSSKADEKPKVWHFGAALQGIASDHADILNPREIKTLYLAAAQLWNVEEPEGDA